MHDIISIIVPIYKVEKYLERCIDSILNQSYSKLEIILIDDGSPDKCGDICDEYVKKDKRIKVIHKKNGGLSDARNCGINISTGKYLMFVDSDDYIDVNMCKILIDYAERYKADIVSCNFYRVYNNNLKKNKSCIKEKKKLLSNIEALGYLHHTADFTVVWNKLYNKRLFKEENKVFFPLGKLHEDSFVMFKLYYFSKLIVVIDLPLYYYVQRNDSIMANINEKNIIDNIDFIKSYISFIKNNNIEIKAKYRLQLAGINDYITLINTSKKSKLLSKFFRDIKNFGEFILFCNKNIRKNPYVSWKIYIKYVLIKTNVYLYYKRYL